MIPNLSANDIKWLDCRNKLNLLTLAVFCVGSQSTVQWLSGIFIRGRAAQWRGGAGRADEPSLLIGGAASYDYVTQVSRANKSDLDHALSPLSASAHCWIVAQLFWCGRTRHAFFKDHHSSRPVTDK